MRLRERIDMSMTPYNLNQKIRDVDQNPGTDYIDHTDLIDHADQSW
jgi:hypothetical protein